MFFNWAEKDAVESKLRPDCVYDRNDQQLIDLIKQKRSSKKILELFNCTKEEEFSV